MLKTLMLSVVLVAAVWVAASGQTKPLSPPKRGVAKQASTENTQNPAEANKDQSRGGKVAPPVDQNPSATASQGNKSEESEDIRIQRKIADLTAGLVWVGALQALALIGTLVVVWRQAIWMGVHAGHFESLGQTASANTVAIKRQAQLMNRQALIMVHQLKEMRKVSEIENRSLILQYRPKLIVRSAKAADFNTALGLQARCRMEFQLVNTGGSAAHIFAGEIRLLAVLAISEHDIRMMHGTEHGIGITSLQPGVGTNVEEWMTTGALVDTEWMDFYEGRAAERRYLYLQGTIWYRDDLGIPRRTGLSRKYDPSTRRFTPEKDSEEEYSD